MAPKMHAAVVEQFRKPLELLELDIPSPGAGEILMKTEACGVCHTDLHAAHGDWPVKPTLILGRPESIRKILSRQKQNGRLAPPDSAEVKFRLTVIRERDVPRGSAFGWRDHRTPIRAKPG
jgi:mono/diheme cytochrome c family protein